MRLEELISSVTGETPTETTPAPLKALCLDRRNMWQEAHEAVQDEKDAISAAVHAYLHRKEGDIWNANYWYRNAGRKAFQGSLDAEWKMLIEETCRELGLHVD